MHQQVPAGPAILCPALLAKPCILGGPLTIVPLGHEMQEVDIPVLSHDEFESLLDSSDVACFLHLKDSSVNCPS
jgi:hypothetical protein